MYNDLVAEHARTCWQGAARRKLLQATAAEFAARQQADIASLEMVVVFLRASGAASTAELEPFAMRIKHGNRCHDAFFADLEGIVGIEGVTMVVGMVDKLKKLWWEASEERWKLQCCGAQVIDTSPAPTLRMAAPAAAPADVEA